MFTLLLAVERKEQETILNKPSEEFVPPKIGGIIKDGAQNVTENPFDLVPDMLPVIGQLDDVAVIGACLILVEQDLHKYKD